MGTVLLITAVYLVSRRFQEPPIVEPDLGGQEPADNGQRDRSHEILNPVT